MTRQEALRDGSAPSSAIAPHELEEEPKQQEDAPGAIARPPVTGAQMMSCRPAVRCSAYQLVVSFMSCSVVTVKVVEMAANAVMECTITPRMCAVYGSRGRTTSTIRALVRLHNRRTSQVPPECLVGMRGVRQESGHDASSELLGKQAVTIGAKLAERAPGEALGET